MAKQAGKGVEEFRPYVTRSIPIGARIVCADNSGAKILEVINVPRHKTRGLKASGSSSWGLLQCCGKKGTSRA